MQLFERMLNGLRAPEKQTFVGLRFSYVLLRLDIDGGRLPHVVVGRMHYVCYEYKFRERSNYWRMHLSNFYLL